MTSTNGFAASPRAAARNGVRNSSPPSVGESTLLWRWTFGIPGIAPSSTSSMPGWPAAVTDTESPSQLMPSEIHRMWTSSTPAAMGSAVIGDPLLFLDVQRLHLQLLAGHDLDVPPAARAAAQREAVLLADRAAAPAADGGRHDAERELRAFHGGAPRRELEGELERRRHDLTQVTDGHLDPRHGAAARVAVDDRDDGLGDRELVHQQILGSGSPTSWSITRRPPKPVSTSTMPPGSVRTSPISAARSPPGAARSACSAASAPAGSTTATSTPSLATCIGSRPRISVAPATIGSTGTAASRTSMATPDARASSLSAEATPPRVASRRQRRAGPAASSIASTAGHSERVSDSIVAPSSNSPRASMIAIPWAPIGPDTRTPTPVVQTYIPSAWPRSTTFVSPVTIFASAASAAPAIAATSARRTSASRPSSRMSERL